MEAWQALLILLIIVVSYCMGVRHGIRRSLAIGDAELLWSMSKCTKELVRMYYRMGLMMNTYTSSAESLDNLRKELEAASETIQKRKGEK